MRFIPRLFSALFAFILSFSFAYADSADKSLRIDWLDKSINPGNDFFKFANGSWQKNNPVPLDYARWGIFQLLQKQNLERVRDILIENSQHAHWLSNNKQKIADFYISGMDENAIEEAGIKPLQPELDRIAQIATLTDLQDTVTHLQLIGVNALFKFGQMQDFEDSTKVIGVASQGGLGLPDRDYYLQTDPKFKQIRQLYVQHVAKMLELLGESAEAASLHAKIVLNIETKLAKASMSRTQQRDPYATYHIMTLEQLNHSSANFSWKKYFSDLQHAEIKQINVAMPEFFKTLDQELKSTSLEDWKTYLRWHVINEFAPYLSKPFVDEDFHMTATLTGAKQLLPRWERIVGYEDEALGFAVGELYVKKYFSANDKEKVQEILNNIRQALKEDLQTLSWMTPATRKAALNKLELMQDRIGYPGKWRSYSGLKIDKGPFVLNVIRSNEFNAQYQLNKIGKPVNKDEWEMTPQTVNAYYDPSLNMLSIPAGILQSPFFDPDAPAAINYGGIGFVIGHEITHGFDDQGAQFDAKGNLKNWWTKADYQKFQAATKCITDQYSQFTVDGNAHVQGKLVTGEATADLGGLILAYRAFHQSSAFKDAKTIDGFTPDQQFFLSAAHIWANNTLPQESRRLVIVDPHPPAKYRVNGTLANMQQFQAAFNIKPNQVMVSKKPCVIW